MVKKSNTAVFVVALSITIGLISGGLWAFREPLQGIFSGQSSPSPTTPSPLPSAIPTTAGAAAVSGTTVSGTTASGTKVSGTTGTIAAPQGVFNYGGSTTWAPLRSALDPILQQQQPQFQLRYTDPAIGAPGSTSGIKMLLEGQLAFSQSSRPLKDQEYSRAKDRGYTLSQIPVAIDGLAFAVNPSLNIPGLTIAQIQQIYLGKVTNWSQVGGPNLAIIPYSRRPEEGGTVEFFIENVLEGKPLSPTVKFIGTTTESLRALADNPGGLYYASAPEVVPQCTIKSIPVGRTSDRLVSPYQEPLVPPQDCPTRRNTLNAQSFQNGDYPVTRQLFVIVKQNGLADQQAGEAYVNWLLSSEGQNLVSKAGFIPIR